MFFFFNDTATTEIYTLSLHDALPIYLERARGMERDLAVVAQHLPARQLLHRARRRLGHRLLEREAVAADEVRSEEHTSELQSRQYLVCRLLLEKKRNETASAHATVIL